MDSNIWQIRYFILAFFITCALPSFAEEDDSDKFAEYKIGIEGVKPMRLPIKEVEELERALLLFGKAVSTCENSQGSWYNFAIDRTAEYKIKKYRFSCNIELTLYSGSALNCLIPNGIVHEFGQAIQERSKTGRSLGDFSNIEKSFLFKKGYCSEK
ncbi:hypothetical protein [Alteromonas sp. 14N.309.X.WAT.G.H12]|uniref:hypothetical protein n=1 Tax=Alteromonas sp. 14N.309.X.WAT.G.H12 TaxID=3120824 RepID=UPI002FD75F96